MVEVERQRTRLTMADSVSLKRAAQDPVSTLGKNEDVIVAALSLLQLSAARGISTDQVSEAIPIHDAYVVSTVAFPCGSHELLAVLPVRVSHHLACEIAMDEDSDLAGEVRLPARAELLGDLHAVLSDYPFVVYEHFAGDAEFLPIERVNPAVAEFAVHDTPYVLAYLAV
jgi:hypothetical protein